MLLSAQEEDLGRGRPPSDSGHRSVSGHGTKTGQHDKEQREGISERQGHPHREAREDRGEDHRTPPDESHRHPQRLDPIDRLYGRLWRLGVLRRRRRRVRLGQNLGLVIEISG